MTLKVFLNAAILATGMAQASFASCDPVEIQIGEQSVLAQRTDDACVTSDMTAAIARTPSGTVRAPVFSEPGVYIQVAAFGLPRNADKTIAKLAVKGFGVWRQEFRTRQATVGYYLHWSVCERGRRTRSSS
ncbi:SPOR domain-containing protein [Qingshengfaniella alkalisoli]|uniref:SPOR domain-containing protein n=1 Tax=Qingshengfaniella alkalisoli TaxID=2599296 RepID=A0A5B8J2Q5_9RHOB|nr:SPOR domain-containing protein [Qingshengfaniella alkalisoli]QDY68540.1 hypothetical protein FPZ52_02160 [Qingshengfaniella alkalisoli]